MNFTATLILLLSLRSWLYWKTPQSKSVFRSNYNLLISHAQINLCTLHLLISNAQNQTLHASIAGLDCWKSIYARFQLLLTSRMLTSVYASFTCLSRMLMHISLRELAVACLECLKKLAELETKLSSSMWSGVDKELQLQLIPCTCESLTFNSNSTKPLSFCLSLACTQQLLPLPPDPGSQHMMTLAPQASSRSGAAPKIIRSNQ